MFQIRMPKKKEEEEKIYFVYNTDEHLITLPKLKIQIIPKPQFYNFDIKDEKIIFCNTRPTILSAEKLENFLQDVKFGGNAKIPFGYELTEEEYLLLEKYYLEQAKAGINSEVFDEECEIKRNIDKIKKLIP